MIEFECPECGCSEIGKTESIIQCYTVHLINHDSGESSLSIGIEIDSDLVGGECTLNFYCVNCGSPIENENGDIVDSEAELLEVLSSK